MRWQLGFGGPKTVWHLFTSDKLSTCCGWMPLTAYAVQYHTQPEEPICPRCENILRRHGLVEAL